MPDHCKCGAEINDTTEFCPACGRNIRAERAEAALKIADGAIDGWRAEVERLKSALAAKDPLPLSESQLERLANGEAIADTVVPADDDL